MEPKVLNWEQLMSPARVIACDATEARQKVSLKNTTRAKGDFRSPFEKDYCHIIYSSAFRRLGRKTQVHPFPDVDYVRFRLTHSLEVSTIAASLAKHVYTRFIDKYGIAPFNLEDVSWVLRTAGLSHDIGNPPYGHAGEKGIKEWAKNRTDFENDSIKRDFSFYDGNAESFHLLSRNDLRSGLYNNLTVAVLGSIVKYPYYSDKATENHAKFGAFDIDKDVFDAVMNELGLKHGNSYWRHPLSFLLEAADDISYNLSDLEDGAKIGSVEEHRVRELFQTLLPDGVERKERGVKKDWAVHKSVSDLRSLVAGVLISEYADTFFKQYDAIMRGEIDKGDSFDAHLTDVVKKWLADSKEIRKEIYNDKRIIAAEQKGINAVSALLDEYMILLKYTNPDLAIADQDRDNVRKVLGDDFLTCRGTRTESWWRHVILDYIVGMTDDYMRASTETDPSNLPNSVEKMK